MNTFVIGIDLHADIAPEDYARLTLAMEQAGFSRALEVDGTWYHLPAGLFHMRSEMATWDIVELAKSTAAPIERAPSIFVIWSMGLAVQNLQIIKE